MFCSVNQNRPNMSSTTFWFVLVLAYSNCQDLPVNVVVIGGGGMQFYCSDVQPYRWYRYLPSNLNDDKVIYMGSRMADEADVRYSVLSEKDGNKYRRLDLSVANVQLDLAGTYKCQGTGKAYCAELIVLDSEPVCDFQISREDGSNGTTEPSCRFNLTLNGEAEMLCQRDSDGVRAEATCLRDSNDTGSTGVVCRATSAADWSVEEDNFTCVIRINHRPLQRYTTCIHASNKPQFTYFWKHPSYIATDAEGNPTALELTVEEPMYCQYLQLMVEVGFPSAGAIIFLLIVAVVCLACKVRRGKDYGRYEKAKKTSTAESPPAIYTPLSFQEYEEIPASAAAASLAARTTAASSAETATYLSANPQFVASPYEGMRRT